VKNLFIVFLFVLSLQSAAQSWNNITLRLKISGLTTKRDLENYRFGFIDGKGTDMHWIMLNEKMHSMYFQCRGQGVDAFTYIVIEKGGNLMAIRVNNITHKTLRLKFRPGHFQINGRRLIPDTSPKPDLDLTQGLPTSIADKR
jgi:hypothetical protein